MKSPTLLTSRQASKLLNMPRSTLTYWLRINAVTPIIPAAKSGSPRVFTLRQVWALGVTKQVRAEGQSLEVACDVANFLSKLHHIDETNPARFNVDRYVIIKDCAVVNKLLSPQDIAKTVKGSAGFYGIEVFDLMRSLIDSLERDQKGKDEHSGERKEKIACLNG